MIKNIYSKIIAKKPKTIETDFLTNIIKEVFIGKNINGDHLSKIKNIKK